MDQNSNYITLEISIRFQMKDHRVVLGLKRRWIFALVVGAIQLIGGVFQELVQFSRRASRFLAG